MRVICAVPSLTETLIEAGVSVVGRTRFCIHPSSKVKSIPVVGGTKDIDWEKVENLKADVLVLDKEENPKSFADDSPISFLPVHIQNIQTCTEGLRLLAENLNSTELEKFAERFASVKPMKVELDRYVEWIHKPSKSPGLLEYIIWKDPIMAVSQNTFIGDVLRYLGQEITLHENKYPKLPDVLDSHTTYLFSSEPFPFAKHKSWIREQNVNAGLVDGESFSWFGIRSLRFLEAHLKIN